MIMIEEWAIGLPIQLSHAISAYAISFLAENAPGMFMRFE